MHLTFYQAPMDNFYINSTKKDRVKDVLVGLWRKRELIWSLANRDIRVKYKRTRLGFMWSFLNPIFMATIFTVFFSQIIQFADDNSILFVLSGYLGWYIFANTLQQSTQVLRESEYILEKINIHRLIIVMARVIAIGLEHLVFVSLVLLYIGFETSFQVQWIYLLPLCYLLSTIAALGGTFIFAGLSVNRQDAMFFVPHLIQIGIWLTPLFYNVQMLPDWLQPMISLNPLSSCLDFWRFALFGQPLTSGYLTLHIIGIMVLFVVGLRFFIKRESLYHHQL